MSWTRWMGLPLAALLAACGGETADTGAEMAEPGPAAEQPAMPSPAPMEPMGMSETATVEGVGDSGVTGEVSVNEQGDQTQVMVSLSGAPASTDLPGHIHTGTCDQIGGVVQPLQPITTDASGSGSTTVSVQVPAMTVMDGQHIVVYHGDGGSPIACAEIPGHVM